jgi:Zn-finger nucleic acid-binding protein
MKCFKCHSDLEPINFRGITVDECPSCHGRWFDRGELRKAKDNTDEDLRWLDFDPFTTKGDLFNRVTQDGDQCPKCSQKMTMLTYKNSGVIIDQCTQCEGVWLPDGEFKKMIAYLEDLIMSESASEYVIDSLKQLMEIITGPEGRIAEVKDFLVILKLLKLRAAVEHSKIAATTNKIYQYLPFL